MYGTHHAGRKEDPWLDVVQRNIAWHLAYGVANRENRIDLIELISPEIELSYMLVSILATN